MVGKRKNRRTADSYQVFLVCLRFLIKFNKTVMLSRNQQNRSDICRNTVGNSLLLLGGDMLGNVPNGSPLLFGHFPAHFCLNQKSKTRQKNIKTISSSSTDYSLSNHTTFSQTQTDATVSLNICWRLKSRLQEELSFPRSKYNRLGTVFAC